MKIFSKIKKFIFGQNLWDYEKERDPIWIVYEDGNIVANSITCYRKLKVGLFI